MIAVITNPNARKNSKNLDRISIFQRILGKHGKVYETKHLSEIDDVCRTIANENPEWIGVCGGDGTQHLVFTGLNRAYLNLGKPIPPLHPLKGGSMNTIAWNLGQKSTAEKTLENMVRRHSLGRKFSYAKLGTMKVNDQYGFFFGMGYTVNFLTEYYASKAQGGVGRAAGTVFRTAGAILFGGKMLERLKKQFNAKVSVDGRPVDYPSYGLFMAGTIQYVGLAFKPLYRARENEKQFHVLVSGLKPSQVLPQTHRFFLGSKLKGTPHHDSLAVEVTVNSEEPLGYTIDGEMYDAKNIQISIGPVVDWIVL